jgi:hypothetical protein
MASKAEIKEDFVKVDLHIHTPASTCYKGPKTEDEYLQIIREAHAKGLRIIAITDHNSIEGYRTLLRVRERLTNERRFLSAITDSIQAKSRLKSLESDLEIFNSILILPGIEFEVNNGIHLLVVFNDNTPHDHLINFLTDGGYRPDNFGAEEPSVLSNWDIFRLFEESAKYDCIIIDAHTDSDKGILNTTRPGIPRAKCFSSPHLSAICYKSEEQKEKLNNTLTTQKAYYRSTPLAFLKFSDAHRAKDVGQPLSWVKVEKVSFQSLKLAFSNPSEMVATEEPSVSRILDALLHLPNSFGVPDFSTASLVNIKNYICALGNTEGGGYILIGVTPSKGKIGITRTDILPGEQPYESLLAPLIDCFRGVEPTPRASANIYPLQNNKVIVSIHIPKSPTLVNVKDDGRVYSIKGNSISVLKATDIEHLVQDKLLKDIESRISRRLESVHNDCNLIKNIFSSLPIIRSFDSNSIPAGLKASLSKSISLDSKSIEKLNRINLNGTSRGNLFFIHDVQSPRLPYTYLRYSLPLFTLRNINQPALQKETIYIVPGGAVYYSKRGYPFFSERLAQVIKVYGPINPSTKFIAAFLKSSFNLWYLKNKLDDIDIYEPDVFNKLRLPKLNTKRPDVIQILKDLQNNFDTILKLEAQLLAKITSVRQNDMLAYLNKHNSRIDEIAYNIDRQIYQLLNLSKEQIITIEENLRLNNIYLPKSLPN